MADPQKQPIAALLENLKDTAAMLRERSTSDGSTDRRADLAAEATDMANLAHHLEAAINAQVEYWRFERRRLVPIGVDVPHANVAAATSIANCIRDLKGEQ